MKNRPSGALLALLVCACADLPSTSPVVSERLALSNGGLKNTFIVFQSNRSGNTDIWRVNGDGTNLTRLTDDPAIDALPDVSPDGRSIVFISNRGDGSFDLHVMDADGGNVRRLTDFSSTFPTSPVWSPDGTRIAFELGFGSWIINADGTGLTRIDDAPSDVRQPDWAPNGSLVFQSGSDPSDIWMLDDDGNLSAVTDTLDPDHSESAAAVSPNGRNVAYARVPWFGLNSEFEIWVTGIDGRKSRRLTTGPGVDGAPAWSPDGRMIVFHRHDGDGNRGLYVVALHGPDTEPRLLLENPQGDAFPSWSR